MINHYFSSYIAMQLAESDRRKKLEFEKANPGWTFANDDDAWDANSSGIYGMRGPVSNGDLGS